MSFEHPHDQDEIDYWKYLAEWERLEFYLDNPANHRDMHMTYTEYYRGRAAGKIEGPSKAEMTQALRNPPHDTDPAPYDHETAETL